MTIDTMQNMFFLFREQLFRERFFFNVSHMIYIYILIKQIYYYDEPYLIRQS